MGNFVYDTFGVSALEVGDAVKYIPVDSLMPGYFLPDQVLTPTLCNGMVRDDGVVTINGTILPFEQVLILSPRWLSDCSPLRFFKPLRDHSNTHDYNTLGETQRLEQQKGMSM